MNDRSGEAEVDVLCKGDVAYPFCYISRVAYGPDPILTLWQALVEVERLDPCTAEGEVHDLQAYSRGQSALKLDTAAPLVDYGSFHESELTFERRDTVTLCQGRAIRHGPIPRILILAVLELSMRAQKRSFAHARG